MNGAEPVRIELKPQHWHDLRRTGVALVLVGLKQYWLHRLGDRGAAQPGPNRICVGLPADAFDEIIDQGWTEWSTAEQDQKYLIYKQGAKV